MSRIDDLIAELCPHGVPYMPLGEIGQLVRGNGMPKTDFTGSGVGAIHYGQIYTYYGTWTTETISYVPPEKAAKLAKANPGDLMITNTSENLEDVGKAVAWIGADQIVTGGHATVFKHEQDSKFLAYWFQTPEFFIQKKKHATGTKVIDVSASSLAKISVPVPPLEIQRGIVRILDTFAELEAELEARRRQYAYYRNTAFQTMDQVPSKPLSEVVSILNGFSFLSSKYVDSGMRIIRISDVQKGSISDKDKRHYPLSQVGGLGRYSLVEGDLVLSLSGSVGRVAIIHSSHLPAALNQRVACLRPTQSNLLPKFLFHYLNRDEFEYEAVNSTSGGIVKNLSSRWLGEVLIPVPDLDEQRRIVSLLDRFDALVNDLSIGLPAELAARRKQYEYYRDRLLTFQELSS